MLQPLIRHDLLFAEQWQQSIHNYLVIILDKVCLFEGLIDLFNVGELHNLKVFSCIFQLKVSGLSLCFSQLLPRCLLWLTPLELISIILNYILVVHYLVANFLLHLVFIVCKVILKKIVRILVKILIFHNYYLSFEEKILKKNQKVLFLAFLMKLS